MKQKHYIAGLYYRLSQEDERQGESLSIDNQRTILRKYAEEHGFEIHDEYIDDGVSGTTFQRPEVQRLLDDAKTGVINAIIVKLGGEPTNFMAQPQWFRPLYVLLEIWQTFGYSAIIYIAAMMNIDPTLYEAAEIDGATRWTKIWRVTLPCLMPSIITMLIISVGNIFTVNLDRILLMYNTGTYETADVLQTYVYRIAFQSTGFPDYSYGTAVNLVKSIIAFILVMAVNKIADKVADSRFF